jgi:hypothetical protein
LSAGKWNPYRESIFNAMASHRVRAAAGHFTDNRRTLQRFRTIWNSSGSRGTSTAYVIDEFGVAVPLIIVLFAVGFWLNRDRALKVASTAS